ncbi:transketolase family protein [Christensenella intestinihominis]|uniref:transketolase family protein n=1 Tax=Christensenella intestinihominis TaxID=1851429 RepID=UPI00082D45FE|nr:transketolase family protein [Christensenella intestinihominis]
MKGKISTRDVYGDTLKEIGVDERVVVLDADVSTCTMSCVFGEAYPERFFNVGIAEANMVGMAAGMAAFGLKPFVSSFAMFIAGRTFEQIRNSVAYPGLDVKLIGTHAGLIVGEDGATHQCLEDIALMRSIPGMVVICPADGNETRQAVLTLNQYEGPAYLRIGRAAVETVTDFEAYSFEIGKAVEMRQGSDITVIACGIAVGKALEAAEMLAQEGVRTRVLNMHTIKPIDREAIAAAARETGAIVTAEEHNIMGGLGSAVSEVVGELCPVPVLRIGTQDTFGRSGNADRLLEAYGISTTTIAEKAREALRLK